MRKSIISLFCLFFIIQHLYPQSWIKKPDFPGNGRYKIVGFSINNFGYAGLGLSSGKLERDFWKYDPSMETWTQIDSFPAPGRIGAASFVINGKGYVAGGETYEGETRTDVWEYDPNTNTWTKKSDIPIDLVAEDNLVGFSIGNYGYVQASYNTPSDFFQYDPKTDNWTAKPNFPGGTRILYEVGFSVNGKGYVGSGFKETENTNDFWQYDPRFSSWKKIADFPGDPRNNAVAFNTEKYGYVGLGRTGGTYDRDFWRYNPENNSWTQIDSCNFAAEGAFSFSINSKGYVGTGIFWQYTPVVDRVTNFAQNREIIFFPNPVKNKINFSNPLNIKIKKIELIDLSGRTIQQWNDPGFGKQMLQIESVIPGIYLLKIETEFGTETEKLVVQ